MGKADEISDGYHTSPRGRRRAPRGRWPEIIALIVIALLAVAYIWTRP